jgi:mono/diheme cytochrome c family protein
VDGVQYVAVLAGMGGPEFLFNGPLAEGSRTGPGRLLAFRLDGAAQLPDPVPPLPPIPAPTYELRVTAAEIAEGNRLYDGTCLFCHGMDVIGGGITPDLRRSTAEVHAQFVDIVLGGARASLGMPAWDDVYTPEEVRLIQGYILHRARESAGGY